MKEQEVDFKKLKVEISFSDDIVGVIFKQEDIILDWNNMTPTEKNNILLGIEASIKLFSRFV